MSTSPAVEIAHLAYRYGDRAAIHDLSLSVSEREIFAILGPNGSGKSTLMRLLSTVMKVQEGRLLFEGSDLQFHSDRFRQNIGVVFQTSTLDRKLTVRENLTLMAKIQGLSKSEVRSRTEKLLFELELTENANARAAVLSGGNRRRAELAMALLHRPKLLLLDEPTVGLDPLARRDFWTLISKLRRELGVTVVVATHFLDEAEYCDRLALLHKGSLVALGSPHELTARFTSDRITISTKHPEVVAKLVEQVTKGSAISQGSEVHFDGDMARTFVPELMGILEGRFDAISVKRAGLESFFIDAVEQR